MLTVQMTEMVLRLVELHLTSKPPDKKTWMKIRTELIDEIKRHRRAIDLSNQRNASKHGRRGHRGPTA